MKSISELNVKLFADGADRDGILDLYRNPAIKGFTTNPTLMRKAGIADYRAFALDILSAVPDRPFSFEVFADEFREMERQAMQIAEWGANVYVKLPITNTLGEPTYPLIHRLARRGLKLNITALMPICQVQEVCEYLEESPSAYVSVFAGRVADTGRDPVPLMAEAVRILEPYPNLELIWASPRELLNIMQADEIGCHIITVTHDLLKKLSLVGKELLGYSLETVKMFHTDGQLAGFAL